VGNKKGKREEERKGRKEKNTVRKNENSKKDKRWS
jgi:hypothetical protein